MLAYRAQIEGQRDARAAEDALAVEQAEAVDHDAEMAKCAAGVDGCLHWIDTWVWTYDPRLVSIAGGEDVGGYVRMRLWRKQVEAVRWVFAMLARAGPTEGAWEKARDGGASYLCIVVALWFWLFVPGSKWTFGSRVKEEVDERDSPDTLFEKMRGVLRRLPAWQLPAGFSWDRHDNYMRLSNPENGASIRGQGGKNMGRGGRSTAYVVDEAAFVENAFAVERAVTGNADCVLWVSTANAIGDLIYQKLAKLPPECRFKSHWTDDPRKTEAWAAKKRAGYVDPTGFAREYDVDWTASLENVCIPAAWVLAAQQLAAVEPGLRRIGSGVTGADIGGGKANSVAIHRFGPVVLAPERRTEADTTETAYWLLERCKAAGTSTLNFDAPGIGAGVLSTLSKAENYDEITRCAINTGNPPSDRLWGDVDEDEDRDALTAADVCGNLKAEIWLLAASAFQRTYEHVRFMRGEDGGRKHPISELISIPDDPVLAAQLSMVRRFRNERGKIVIETKAQLRARNVPSPDDADALVLTFIEPPDDGIPSFTFDASWGHRRNPWAIGGGEDADEV